MTPSRTPFAGYEQLQPGDPLSSDGFAFQFDNPAIMDLLSKIGAVTHKHDAHAAMADPTTAPTLAVVSGGTVPAGTAVSVEYTLIDPYGGESLPSAAAIIDMPPGYTDPADAPSGSVNYASGTLLANTYSYAITVTDGLGGETALGPALSITVDPTPGGTATVDISGLTAITDAASSSDPASGWRLWRSLDGSLWYLIGSGPAATDTFTDSGVAGDCSVAPPDEGTTGASNGFSVTVPSAGQPASATAFNLYACDDGAFNTPCFLGQFPLSDYDTAIDFTDLTVTWGHPPLVSTCYPGANKIDPDTDLLNWTWKQPVATEAGLPSVGNTDGDTRIALDTLLIYTWNGTAWERSPFRYPVANFAALPTVDLRDGDVCMTLDTHALWVYDLAVPEWRMPTKVRQSVQTVLSSTGGTETAETLEMLGEGMVIYAIHVDQGCHLRLYPTAALAAADISRVSTPTPPTEVDYSTAALAAGCLFDWTPAGTVLLPLAPVITAVNQEGTPSKTIAANLKSSVTVTVTLYGYRVE